MKICLQIGKYYNRMEAFLYSDDKKCVNSKGINNTLTHFSSTELKKKYPSLGNICQSEVKTKNIEFGRLY